MTDLRDLITEMADELDHNRQCLLDDRRVTHPLADKARAVLAEPEPEWPTDDELIEAFDEEFAEFFDAPDGFGITAIPRTEWIEVARAVLARWGNSSAPQPIPVSERLPGPEDCDAEGMCWWYCAPAERWLRCGIPEPDPASQVHTHWLPANALPLPQ